MSGTIIFFLLCSSVVKISGTPVYRTNLFNIVGHQRGSRCVSLIEACGLEMSQKSEWSASKIRKKNKIKKIQQQLCCIGWIHWTNDQREFNNRTFSQPLHRIWNWTLVSLALLQLGETHQHSVSGQSDQGSDAYVKASRFLNANFFQNASMIRDDHISQRKKK